MRRSIGSILIAGLAVVLMLSATPALAAPPVQDDGGAPVSVTSARDLRSVVDDDNAWFSSLSPSGAMLAYYSESGGGRNRVKNVCIYTFENAGKSCYELPAEFEPYPYNFAWSPDDASIAFTENPIEFGNDGDIWLMDVASGEYANLTDDRFTGSWHGAESPINVDYLPFWSQEDGTLYFWCAVPMGSMQFTIGIYSVSPEGGEPELVRDLTDAIPGSLPFFKQEQFYLDGPAALSPDGTTVAALMSTLDPMGAVLTSLYLIDLTDPEAEPIEAVASDGWSTAVPEWQTWPAAPISLSWTGDSAGVVVLESSPDPHTPFMVFDYIDAATQELTPVVDFSDLADPEAYLDIVPAGSLPWRAYSPWTATISPKGDKLLMVNDLGGVIGLFTAALPPDGMLPQVAASAESNFISTASRSSRAADGKVLIYGLVATVEEE